MQSWCTAGLTPRQQSPHSSLSYPCSPYAAPRGQLSVYSWLVWLGLRLVPGPFARAHPASGERRQEIEHVPIEHGRYSPLHQRVLAPERPFVRVDVDADDVQHRAEIE